MHPCCALAPLPCRAISCDEHSREQQRAGEKECDETGAEEAERAASAFDEA
jgi:hypothetical protein